MSRAFHYATPYIRSLLMQVMIQYSTFNRVLLEGKNIVVENNVIFA